MSDVGGASDSKDAAARRRRATRRAAGRGSVAALDQRSHAGPWYSRSPPHSRPGRGRPTSDRRAFDLPGNACDDTAGTQYHSAVGFTTVRLGAMFGTRSCSRGEDGRRARTRLSELNMELPPLDAPVHRLRNERRRATPSILRPSNVAWNRRFKMLYEKIDALPPPTARRRGRSRAVGIAFTVATTRRRPVPKTPPWSRRRGRPARQPGSPPHAPQFPQARRQRPVSSVRRRPARD